MWASPNRSPVAMKFRMHTKVNGPTSFPSICATKVEPQRKAARTSRKLYPKFAILVWKVRNL